MMKIFPTLVEGLEEMSTSFGEAAFLKEVIPCLKESPNNNEVVGRLVAFSCGRGDFSIQIWDGFGSILMKEIGVEWFRNRDNVDKVDVYIIMRGNEVKIGEENPIFQQGLAAGWINGFPTEEVFNELFNF
jgi:hypothetical protein